MKFRSSRLTARGWLEGGLRWVWLGVLLITSTFGAGATTYQAPLPVQLSTDPDLCAYVPCQEVMPSAERFSLRKGHPAYVEAYRTVANQEQLNGYVFLSTDIVDIPAYSGKPVVTLIGMDREGKIVGVKILKHSEPILLVGIPESELTKFTLQFIGKSASDKVEIGKSRAADGYLGIDAISGATVTVIAENQVIMRSTYEIARQVGLIQTTPKAPAALVPINEALTWQALVEEGSVQRLTVRSQDIGAPDSDIPFIDLYFGYLNAPNVGRNILGEDNYQNLMRTLKPGTHAVFIIASGASSFKGSGFVRGGIFDRFQIVQDMDTFTFRDTDYLNLYGIQAAGAPRYRESGIFIIRNAGFSPAYPWYLAFLANLRDERTGIRTFSTFDKEYWLPDRYLVGGRAEIAKPEPVWLRAWKMKPFQIMAFATLLMFTATVYGFRDRLVRKATHKDKAWIALPKYLIWAASVAFVGFHAMAQPSITQVLTWFHSLLFHWQWELFLSDPFIFIFWWFIILTVLVWGRGLFCGWLCPFGSLTEILFKVGQVLGLRRIQFALPQPWHDRLKWLKYGIFFALLGISLFSMETAERLAEIEPFKTTFLVGVWNRSWPYGLFCLALLTLSVLMERPFCKYLCPLGAGLAIPTTFRFFGLKRKAECRTCKACAVGCGSLAINRQGVIDHRECLLCLDCMILYYDDHACPPLAKERKSRAKTGAPLSPILPQGYFAPVSSSSPLESPLVGGISGASITVTNTAIPASARFPQEAAPMPGGQDRIPFGLWLGEEAIDHLLPWEPGFPSRSSAIYVLGMGLAMAAILVFVLHPGELNRTVTVIVCWVGWTLYELGCRRRYKPWIKEGPWWGRARRSADTFELFAYVATKNLLLGTLLFLMMSVVGWLR